jgi:hypothetical protein
MTNDFYISVQTRKDMNSSVDDLVRCWCKLENRELRPEFFSNGEPVTRSLAQEGVEAAIRLWKEERVPLMLRRVTQPRFLADLANVYETADLAWIITIWLDRKAGDTLAQELLRFFVVQLDPEYAFASTEADVKEKHFIRHKKRIGKLDVMAEEYVGLKAVDKLPGIYWRTYFGPKYAPLLRSVEPEETAHGGTLDNISHGKLLSAFDASSMAGTKDASAVEADLVNRIGAGYFFSRLGKC